jgi:hypothetical protein
MRAAALVACRRTSAFHIKQSKASGTARAPDTRPGCPALQFRRRFAQSDVAAYAVEACTSNAEDCMNACDGLESWQHQKTQSCWG